MLRPLTTLVTCIALASVAAAHEFWIEPTKFQSPAGRVIALHLRVGMDMKGEPVPRNAKRLIRFDAITGDQSKPVPGEDGVDPAGFLRVEKAGLTTVAFVSNATTIELEPEKFASYLKEEGLDTILADREKRGESDKLGREAYARSCKSFILVGGEGRDTQDWALGLPLEFVVEKNPYSLKPGDKLTVRLLRDGKPLANSLVVGIHRELLDKRPSQRTDAEGRATLELPKSGMWLIKAVDMRRAASGVDADWESIWASLTFELPEADGSPASAPASRERPRSRP